MSEHGDVMKTQTIKFCPPSKFSSKLGPCTAIENFIPIGFRNQKKSRLLLWSKDELQK